MTLHKKKNPLKRSGVEPLKSWTKHGGEREEEIRKGEARWKKMPGPDKDSWKYLVGNRKRCSLGKQPNVHSEHLWTWSHACQAGTIMLYHAWRPLESRTTHPTLQDPSRNTAPVPGTCGLTKFPEIMLLLENLKPPLKKQYLRIWTWAYYQSRNSILIQILNNQIPKRWNRNYYADWCLVKRVASKGLESCGMQSTTLHPVAPAARGDWSCPLAPSHTEDKPTNSFSWSFLSLEHKTSSKLQYDGFRPVQPNVLKNMFLS